MAVEPCPPPTPMCAQRPHLTGRPSLSASGLVAAGPLGRLSCSKSSATLLVVPPLLLPLPLPLPLPLLLTLASADDSAPPLSAGGCGCCCCCRCGREACRLWPLFSHRDVVGTIQVLPLPPPPPPPLMRPPPPPPRPGRGAGALAAAAAAATAPAAASAAAAGEPGAGARASGVMASTRSGQWSTRRGAGGRPAPPPTPPPPPPLAAVCASTAASVAQGLGGMGGAAEIEELGPVLASSASWWLVRCSSMGELRRTCSGVRGSVAAARRCAAAAPTPTLPRVACFILLPDPLLLIPAASLNDSLPLSLQPSSKVATA